MDWLRQLRFRLISLFRRRRLEAEMAEEMRVHQERQVEANLTAGMSAEDARHDAQRMFGAAEQIKEEARDQRSLLWLDQGLQDVRHAARALWQRPGFSAVAIVTLALGTSASLFVFGVFETAVLRPLPVRSPQELALLGWHRTAPEGNPRNGFDMGEIEPNEIDPASGQPVGRYFSRPAYDRFRADAASTADLVAVARWPEPNVNIDGQLERIGDGEYVSGNYHRVLGVAASVGRTLLPEDDRPGAEPAVVISYRFWQQRFGGDPAVVGKKILLSRVPATIVGVTAPGFTGVTNGRGDLAVPLSLLDQMSPDAPELQAAGYWWLRILGRLKPGANADQLRAALEPDFNALAAASWNAPNALPRLLAGPGGYGQSEKSRRAAAVEFLPLAVMVALLLLVACANQANLLLARGASRRRELAVRLALGASRGRLLRQLFMESVLLALAGSGLGLLLATWGLGGIIVLPGMNPAWSAASLDWRLAGCCLALALLAAGCSGLLPAWRATRLSLMAEFQGGPRSLSGGSRSKLGRGLMVAQMALSLTLLVLAGLLGRTVRNLVAVDIGFNRDRLLLFTVQKPDKDGAFYHDAIDRISRIPGVSGVTFSGGGYNATFALAGDAAIQDAQPTIEWSQVDAHFFETYGLPLQLGRSFTPADQTRPPQVVVINQSLAEKYFPRENPLGRHVRFGFQREQREAEIVGVVRDFRQPEYNGLRRPIGPTVFTPEIRLGPSREHFAVRTSGAPEPMLAAIRQAVAAVNPEVPLTEVQTQAAEIDDALETERLVARLATFLGVASLALASVGLYGMMSYGVHRRTNEIGMRIALGARPGTVGWMFLRESLALAGIGAITGTLAATAAARLVASLLYGLSPIDPPTFGAASLLLLAVILFAAWFPARRAAKVDPMVALRAE